VSNVTDEIKARVDLVELIGRAVQLKRSGSSYRGLCPFHQEKTPSFYVFPASHTWVCFGCGKKGSAFDWLMEREHLEFGEALRSLAQMTGVALPERRDVEQEETTRRLYAVLETAAAYYQSALAGSVGAAGRAYMRDRGIDEPTLRSFGIGFAPPGGGLLRHLQAKGFSDAELVAAGVVGQADDGRLYDFFRERVLFPIRDSQGRTIAFGGRAMEAGVTPKYLNTRDSLLFHKQETLFAFDMARRAIAQERQAVIVEGYMDALMAHQHGFRNVVATLGTAVTDRHLRQLARIADQIPLALDPDAAGQSATWRTLQMAEQSLRSGLTPVVGPNRRQRRYVPDRPVALSVILLPDGKDPDELIRSDPAQWPRLVQAAQPVIDFVLDRLANRYDLATGQGKAAAADEVTDMLAGIADPIEQAHYVQQVAQLLKVGEGAVHQALRRKQRWGTGRTPPEQEGAAPAEAEPELVERDVDDEYALALTLRLHELNAPLDTTGTEMDLALSESRALFRALRLDGGVPAELKPYLERVEQRRPLVGGFSAAEATAELTRVRMRLRRRGLLERRRQLRELLAETHASGTRDEQDQHVSAMWQVTQELGKLDEAEAQLERPSRVVVGSP
jgi:DNA primase